MSRVRLLSSRSGPERVNRVLSNAKGGTASVNGQLLLCRVPPPISWTGAYAARRTEAAALARDGDQPAAAAALAVHAREAVGQRPRSSSRRTKRGRRWPETRACARSRKVARGARGTPCRTPWSGSRRRQRWVPSRARGPSIPRGGPGRDPTVASRRARGPHARAAAGSALRRRCPPATACERPNLAWSRRSRAWLGLYRSG